MALPDLWFCILYTVFRHHDWATDHLRCSLCACPCSSDVSFGPLAWPVPRAPLDFFACSGSSSPASRGRGGRRRSQRRRSQRRRRSGRGWLAGSQEQGSTRPGKFTGEGGAKEGPTSRSQVSRLARSRSTRRWAQAQLWGRASAREGMEVDLDLSGCGSCAA